jgi:hypothetical protein
MSQSKFVSSIPNNKLEPVFLGGGSGPSAKSSGAYVPSFLRNEETRDKKDTGTKHNEFNMTDDDFPSLLSAKPVTKEVSKNFTHYSDALKKDIDKPRPKVIKSNPSGGKNTKKKQIPSILDDSSKNSGDYSDTYNSDDGF